MTWTPGQPSPDFTLEQVLTMLGVAQASRADQRRAVEAAVADGGLGEASLRALRAAGWLEPEDAAAGAGHGDRPVPTRPR